jgi:phenylalanyl-tRNA synthetase beta chain
MGPHCIEGDTFIVDPPSYRFDLHIEEDLIEEVARVYGFERIPAVSPSTVATMRVKPSTYQSPHTLRHQMAALDYQEVVNFSFVEAQWEHDYIGNDHPIKLLNPLARQFAVMRSSLLSGLLANIHYNANRQQSRGRIFELARVFLRDANIVDSALTVAGVYQPLRLAAAAWGSYAEEQWGTVARQVDFYDLKMDIEALFGARAAALRFVATPHPLLHPGRSARIELAGKPVGWLGELHPRWGPKIGFAGADKLMPILFELDVQPLTHSPVRPVQELSRQPAVVRDLAFWVKTDVAVQTLLDTITDEQKADAHLAIVQEVRLFDCWWEKTATGAAKEKSLAFRFWLQDTDTTLDDARVTDCLARLTHRLVQTHGARLRS